VQGDEKLPDISSFLFFPRLKNPLALKELKMAFVDWLKGVVLLNTVNYSLSSFFFFFCLASRS